ncbi:MAG TPA: hypothetical protein VE960_06835, partial [bacterium]|nr:hypothetical protein [bacterium]
MRSRRNLTRGITAGILTATVLTLLAAVSPAGASTGSAAGRDGPVLTSDDFFHEVGDYYRSWSNDLNVSVSGLLGSAGGPQTWDFTTGPTDEIKRFDYVPIGDGDDPGA